jgi:hypothetical protein
VTTDTVCKSAILTDGEAAVGDKLWAAALETNPSSYPVPNWRPPLGSSGHNTFPFHLSASDMRENLLAAETDSVSQAQRAALSKAIEKKIGSVSVHLGPPKIVGSVDALHRTANVLSARAVWPFAEADVMPTGEATPHPVIDTHDGDGGAGRYTIVHLLALFVAGFTAGVLVLVYLRRNSRKGTPGHSSSYPLQGV